MHWLLFSSIIAFLCYVFFPLFGAFWVRRNWRLFRKHLAISCLYPELTFTNLHNEKSGTPLRAFGVLDSFGENNSLWVKTGNTTVQVFLQKGCIYQLPKNRNFDLANLDEIEIHDLKRLGVHECMQLPEGSQLYVFGPLNENQNRREFRSSDHNPVYVLVYDENPETVVFRALWEGRQTNEVWNPITPWAVILGFLGLVIFLNWFIGMEQFQFLLPLMILETTIPALLVLPPGLVLFFLYTKFWKKSRLQRSKRDVTELVYQIKSLTDAKTIREYSLLEPLINDPELDSKRALHNKRSWIYTVLSTSLLISGFLLNSFLCFELLRRIL